MQKHTIDSINTATTQLALKKKPLKKNHKSSTSCNLTSVHPDMNDEVPVKAT